MPVEDVNAVRMGSDLLNAFTATSEVSNFWKDESDIITIFAIGLILLFLAFIMIFLAKVALSMALRR